MIDHRLGPAGPLAVAALLAIALVLPTPVPTAAAQSVTLVYSTDGGAT